MANDKKTGLYEVEFQYAPRAGGKPVLAVTTPSMWARADEWSDTLRVGAEPHSQAWVTAKMVDAARLLAAQAAGIVRPGALSLELIAEMTNAWEIRDTSAEDAPGGDGGEGN